MITQQLIDNLQQLMMRSNELIDTLKEAFDVDDQATIEVALGELELNSNALTEAVSRLTPVDAAVPDKPNAETQPND
jgi:ribosomal protein L7/L12